MRRKRGSTNIKILQSQIQNIALQEDNITSKQEHKPIQNVEIKGSGVPIQDVPIVEKIKKKGIKKDELINTRRLLTM
jgi:hypothetical protein